MDEYNINNIQKINSINFININEDQSLRANNPYIKINHLDYINPLNISDKPYTKSIRKISTLNKKNIKIASDRIYNTYKKIVPKIHDINYNDSPNPLSSISLYHPRTKSLHNKTEIKNNKSNLMLRKNIEQFNDFNNNTYEYSFENNEKMKFNSNNLQNNLILKNQNLIQNKFYEQIKDLKQQNNILVKKLNYYLNDIKSKAKEINNLKQNYLIMQNELNKKQNEEKYSNKSNDQILKAMLYKSKININDINYNNKSIQYKPNTKIDQISETNKTNINQKLFNTNSDKNININTNKSQQIQLNNNNNEINIRKILEKKIKEVKILYQKIKAMKNDIDQLTLKNVNLNKLLTKKNMDLINYQKREIEKEKKIEQLNKLIFQQSYNNQSISNKKDIINNVNKNNDENINQIEKENKLKLDNYIKQINILKNEIKSRNLKIKDINETNKVKTLRIEELTKKIDELETDNKGLKSEEKLNLYDIKKYKSEMIVKDGEIKEINKKLYNYEEEKNNLLNEIDNKEKEINSNINKISELKKDLEQNKKIIEEKDKEIKIFINTVQELKELNKKINNSNKEDRALLNKIKELSDENNKLTNQINIITSKYSEKKKKLVEANKKLKEYQENEKKIKYLNPETCIIITNKRYKKLIWYLIYKKSEKHKKNENEDNNYENYFWVTNEIIKNDDLNKFNKFEDDNDKNNELREYVNELQKKLEKKEESINKLDYQNKKLAKELLNKTANLKGNILLKKKFKR